MPDQPRRASLSSAGWLAIGVLIGFLAVAIWYAVYTWGEIGDAQMSGFGWFALVAGSLLTIAVGGGLMALLFYSNRNDFDR